jgi:hypothetical protein
MARNIIKAKRERFISKFPPKERRWSKREKQFGGTPVWARLLGLAAVDSSVKQIWGH